MTITTPLLFSYPFHQQSDHVAWLLHVQRCGCQTLDGRFDLHLHLLQYEHVEATLQENQYKSHLPPNGGHINFPRRLQRMDPRPWVAHVGKLYPPSLAFWHLHIPSFPPQAVWLYLAWATPICSEPVGQRSASCYINRLLNCEMSFIKSMT